MAIATKPKPKTTPYHKRRHGTHQKRSNHFVKTYWPYLPLLFVVGIGIIANTLLGNQSGVLGYATNMTHNGLLASTNVQRQENKLPSLALSETLSRAAQAKAEDMVHKNYWSHTTPDGQEPWIFINQTGYQYQAAGENLAYGFISSDAAVIGWMNSPGHRANILNGEYQEVGFGIANAKNYQGEGEQTIVVAMYAQPSNHAIVSAVVPETPENTQATRNGQPIAASADNQSGKIRVSAVVPGQTKVARVQMATSGSAPWSLYAISLVGAMLIFLFLIRHSLAWHRVVVRGEDFILKHKVLDVIIVSGIMIGFILTRTAGVIQ
jgi:hypothetical protein